MISWKKFEYKGVIYSLSHLHPFEMNYIQQAKDDKLERVYPIDVTFSLHCFTRSQKGSQNVDSALLYSDSREIRVFDFPRYELSKQLPQIIRSLDRCYHTEKGNYFTVVLQNMGEYDVYFKVARSSIRGRLTLFVQSAYIRDPNHEKNRPRKKPIKFGIIAYNTLIGKPIKSPK